MHTEHQQISQAVPLLQSNVFSKASTLSSECPLQEGPKIFSRRQNQISASYVHKLLFFLVLHTHISVFFSFPSSSQVYWMLRASILVGAVFLLLAKFVRKSKLKTKNSKRKSDFAGFQYAEARGKKRKKIRHFTIFGFQLVAKTIER